MICLNCKNEFQEKSPKAIFCSTSCRVTFHRQKKRLIQEAMGRDEPLAKILDDISEKLKLPSTVRMKSAKVIIKDDGGREGQFVFEEVKEPINPSCRNHPIKKELEKIKDNHEKIAEYEAELLTLGKSSVAIQRRKFILKKIQILKNEKY